MRRRRIGRDLWAEETENPGRKTKRGIITADPGDSLAEIAWHGPWRQYVLWPMLSTAAARTPSTITTSWRT